MHWPAWVAWRLVRSRAGRLLTLTGWAAVTGVFLGVAALVIAMALMTGFQQDLKAKLLGGIPHVTLTGLRPESLQAVLGRLDEVRRLPTVRSVFPTVYAQGLLVSPYGSTGVLIKGVPSEARSDIPVLTRLVGGRWDRLTAQDGVAVGRGLAQRLGVWAGDSVRLVIPDSIASPMGLLPRLRRVYVAAVFQSDMYEFDNTWVFMHVDLARRLFQPSGGASAVELMLDDVDRAPQVARQAAERFRDVGVVTETWMDQNRALFAALQLEKWMLFAAITLIVVVASFNIITHLALMVHEKRSRIAMMMAMGAEGRAIQRVFLYQGLVLGLTGIVAGLIVGGTASFVLDHYRLIRLPVEVYFIPYLPFRLRWLDVLWIALVTAGIVLLAAWFPARQVTQLRPTEILRSPP
ncbi:MAG: ABC transporter permease [Acidobacteria bacterium]|nr:ABC transporter permease [Acidobacteriota bacterium]MDW7983914.1 ABC transporter permease [Acidobacteriota bacterium]